MKRIFLFLMVVALCGGTGTHAQDAAVEERLNKLSGHIEDLLAAKVEQDKRIAVLVREVESLRELLGRPNTIYASAEDVRKLAETVKDVDQKRVADTDKILKHIENIGKTAAGSGRTEPRLPPKKAASPASSGGAETGYEYVVVSGDTLSSIAEAYRVQGVKVSVDQILKANPGLVAERMQVGQKIFIPAPEK